VRGMVDPDDRSGVLVIRVWTEPHSGDVRARVTRKLDVLTDEEVVTVSGSVDEITETVREWLEKFASL